MNKKITEIKNNLRVPKSSISKKSQNRTFPKKVYHIKFLTAEGVLPYEYTALQKEKESNNAPIICLQTGDSTQGKNDCT